MELKMNKTIAKEAAIFKLIDLCDRLSAHITEQEGRLQRLQQRFVDQTRQTNMAQQALVDTVPVKVVDDHAGYAKRMLNEMLNDINPDKHHGIHVTVGQVIDRLAILIDDTAKEHHGWLSMSEVHNHALKAINRLDEICHDVDHTEDRPSLGYVSNEIKKVRRQLADNLLFQTPVRKAK